MFFAKRAEIQICHLLLVGPDLLDSDPLVKQNESRSESRELIRIIHRILELGKHCKTVQ